MPQNRHTKSNEYRQVKAPSGGDARHEIFPTDITLGGVRQQVTEWFLPSGESRRGKIEQFNNRYDDHTTVGELYGVRPLTCKLLRPYLASERKVNTEVETATDSGMTVTDSGMTVA